MRWIDSLKARAVRARVWVWTNRTKVLGYLGVAGGTLQMAIAEGQHWPMLLFGVSVALVGHYNDLERRRES